MEYFKIKKKPIIIESGGLSLVERVKLQVKTLHDFLELEMPEKGWMYNKSVCCNLEDISCIFARYSALYAELDLDNRECETRMLLLVSVLHPKYDICSFCSIGHGNKRQLLMCLNEETTVKIIVDKILSMSKGLEQKDFD